MEEGSYSLLRWHSYPVYSYKNMSLQIIDLKSSSIAQLTKIRVPSCAVVFVFNKSGETRSLEYAISTFFVSPSFVFISLAIELFLIVNGVVINLSRLFKWNNSVFLPICFYKPVSKVFRIFHSLVDVLKCVHFLNSPVDYASKNIKNEWTNRRR